MRLERLWVGAVVSCRALGMRVRRTLAPIGAVVVLGVALPSVASAFAPYVDCTPTMVAVGQPATCTATAEQGDGGDQITEHAFFSAGSGSFSASSCTLSRPGSSGNVSCSVIYTPSVKGEQFIQALFTQDAPISPQFPAFTFVSVGDEPFVQSGPPDGTVGQSYSSRFMITGDPRPTVTESSGELPPGLSLSSDGTLTGTPTQAGSYKFAVVASNAAGIDAATVTVTIKPAALRGASPPKTKGRRVHVTICTRPPTNHQHKPSACAGRTLIGSVPGLVAGASAILVRGKLIYAAGQVGAHNRKLSLLGRSEIPAGDYTLVLRRPHHVIFVSVVLRKALNTKAPG
jgi:Putative Ig domain